jgi:hypothetical protein
MRDPVSDLRKELLAAAERRYGHAPVPRGHRSLRGHLGLRPLLLTSAALSIAAAVALLFTAPWSSSPSFLATAEAALTPPTGTVMHMKWEWTKTSTEAGCTVEVGPNEIWIDQAPPHRYRALVKELRPDLDPASATRRGPDVLALACSSGTPSEIGGEFDPPGVRLRFVPPNTLSFNQLIFEPDSLDPVADLREAIRAGQAHDEGKTELDGRTVERIRIDDPLPCCPGEPAYWYVDPETFYPVETHAPGVMALPGRVVRFHVVIRYPVFEYLPRTAANLALTDIRAQHPDAT